MNFLSKNYIIKFWVGLMDGDGSIQVNHWKHKYLQYRLVIKLKYHSDNLSMLNLFQTHIGGRVRIIHDSVIWVVDSRKSFFKILKIFKKYPPFTTRLRAQIKFAYMCKEHDNIDIYLQTRNNKYLFYEKEFSSHAEQVLCSKYFNPWLSGFIEAEGCFCIRKSNTKSFSLSQKNDFFLLDKIKTYLGIQTRIRPLKNNIWVVETYRKTTLEKLEQHLTKYPLLGEKSLSFNRFKIK